MLGSGHGAPQDPADTLHISVTSWEDITGKHGAVDRTREQAVQETGDTHLIEGPLGALIINADNTLWKVPRGSQPQAAIAVISASPCRPCFYGTNRLKERND